MKLIRITVAMMVLLISWQILAIENIGIPYQKEPRNNLTVGGQPTLEQFETLKKLGFTTIINLRRDGEFNDFNEAKEVARLGMEYIHIPVKNVESITVNDARLLHEGIANADGPVLLHCTVGWRAGSLFAIENYLVHDASESESLDLASKAHMSHANGDVKEWIKAHQKNKR
jgi:uncharacterized protein (TIGR01244 family)